MVITGYAISEYCCSFLMLIQNEIIRNLFCIGITILIMMICNPLFNT